MCGKADDVIAHWTTNDLIGNREKRDGDMNQDVIHREVPVFSGEKGEREQEGKREENEREENETVRENE